MKQLRLPFDEILIPLDRPQTKDEILKYSPAGKVPILIDGDVAVWESLAIMDYLADTHPDLPVWPRERSARAMARSIAAEMHAGFTALRAACPMNLGKTFAHRDRGAAAASDIARVTGIFRETRSRFGAGGPFLFGAFCAADAMYAPVTARLATYSIPLDPICRSYVEAVHALPAYREWLEAALREPWSLAEDEIDEAPIAILRRSA